MKKAAIVIGIAKTGALPVLESARSGAREVTQWLKGEGYDVDCLTDESGSISAQDIKKAISKYVTKPAKYHFLLVYFSGHGYWHARTDHWLLTEAHTYSDEAINVDGAIDIARHSGIPNIVFLSDACRTLPNQWTGAVVKGIDAFPSLDFPQASKVDWFKAAVASRPAYEDEIDGKVQSIFTCALQAAYREPDSSMVVDIQENGQTVKVVPNRKLEDFLKRKVSRLLSKISLTLKMNIDVNVPSSDDVFISKVTGMPVLPGLMRKARLPATDPEPDVGLEAADAIERDMLSGDFHHSGADADDHIAVSQPASEALALRMPNEKLDHYETGCGFSIRGARIMDVAVSGKISQLAAEPLEPGDGESKPGLIRMHHVDHGTTVALRLQGNRVALLAALEGYIAHIACTPDGIASVSYVPSSNNWRFHDYKMMQAKIDRLRSLVSIAIDQNTFRLRSDEAAMELGNLIRVGKALDPVLGLYAAHAYSQAGMDDRVVSVLKYMRNDLEADLFDVRLLSIRKLPYGTHFPPVFPACPLLTQSWNLLRPRGINLHPVLEDASAFLCDSLWTTFEAPIADRLMDALRKGEFDENPADTWTRPGG